MSAPRKESILHAMSVVQEQLERYGLDFTLLGRMTLRQVLPFLERASNRTRDEVAAHPSLNCSLAVLTRAMNHHDEEYFISHGRTPGLSVAWGHMLLQIWALARTMHLSKAEGLDLDPVKPVDITAALAEFAELAEEFGKTAREMAAAAGDGQLDQAECRQVKTRLMAVIAASQTLYAGLTATEKAGEGR